VVCDAGIGFSRCLTLVFVYHLLSYCYNSGATSGQVLWDFEQATAMNTAGSFVGLFVVYDFFYTPFHIALHQPSVYWLVHKHHHRQKAPSRGNTDGINVHPFEFAFGE
jgi:sterol desaturase/sphingolipid hydroxylase (fatty acid hydroxylase superfamily)